MSTYDKEAGEIEDVALKPSPVGKDENVEEWLSTGSTLLNLACSGHPFGGLLRGRYYFVVGDSASGKTFLMTTTLAEAAINPRFKDYRLIYDNVEDGCLLDMLGLFSQSIKDRIEPPCFIDGHPTHSDTIEEFYYHLDDLCNLGRPFIYILDSMDSLYSQPAEEKFEEQKEAYRKGKQAAGSYGDGKAKFNSEHLRRVLQGLRRTGSILIILSQTRDNLGFGYEKKTRSGGRALRFYATVEFWLSVASPITKTIQGKKREVGVRICAEVKKNRVTGKRYSVELDIYPSYGVDDLGSMIDFLVEEKWWEVEKQTIIAKELAISGTKASLIKKIEEEELTPVVQSAVGECWKEIERSSSLGRVSRYKAQGEE